MFGAIFGTRTGAVEQEAAPGRGKEDESANEMGR